MTHGHDKKKEKQGRRKNEMIILFNLMRGCVQEDLKYLNQVQCAFIVFPWNAKSTNEMEIDTPTTQFN